MFSSIVSSHTLAHRLNKAASSLISAPIKGYSGNCPFLRSLGSISNYTTISETAQQQQEHEQHQSKEIEQQPFLTTSELACYPSLTSYGYSSSSSSETNIPSDYEEKSRGFCCPLANPSTIRQNLASNDSSSEQLQQQQQQQPQPQPHETEPHQVDKPPSQQVKDSQQSGYKRQATSEYIPNQKQQQQQQHVDRKGLQYHLYDYSSRLRELIQMKKDDESYRVFRRVRRFSSSFPHGTEQSRPVTIWCSNDYFGMSSHPKVREAILNALNEYGAGSGGTRNIAGNSPLHEQLEFELADLHDKEAALLFSSCYVANDSTLFTLLKLIPDCQVFSDAGNHASMIQGIRNSGAKKHIFRAFDPEHLEEKLKQVPVSVPKIVAFETVHSMTGDISDVGRMCDIAHKYGAITFVDEVHAVGLYGERGAGIAQRDGCMEKIDIVSGTLGKAYGNCGGYVAGSLELIDVIRSYASGFIFTTSLPPTVACGAAESVRILKGDEGRYMRQMQQNNVFHMKRALAAAGLPHYRSKSHIIPIPVGNAAKCTQVMNDLLDLGHYIQSINYPTVPKGTERLRVSVTPFHSEQMIDLLIEKLVSVWMRNDLEFLQPVELPNECSRQELAKENNEEVGESRWIYATKR